MNAGRKSLHDSALQDETGWDADTLTRVWMSRKDLRAVTWAGKRAKTSRLLCRSHIYCSKPFLILFSLFPYFLLTEDEGFVSFLDYISPRFADLHAVTPPRPKDTADSCVGFWNEGFKAFSLSQFSWHHLLGPLLALSECYHFAYLLTRALTLFCRFSLFEIHFHCGHLKWMHLFSLPGC